MHIQIAQLKVKPLEPEKDQLSRPQDIIYIRLLVVNMSVWS